MSIIKNFKHPPILYMFDKIYILMLLAFNENVLLTSAGYTFYYV